MKPKLKRYTKEQVIAYAREHNTPENARKLAQVDEGHYEVSKPDPYDEGKRDWNAGKGRKDNPYNRETQPGEWQGWFNGWGDASDDVFLDLVKATGGRILQDGC